MCICPMYLLCIMYHDITITSPHTTSTQFILWKPYLSLIRLFRLTCAAAHHTFTTSRRRFFLLFLLFYLFPDRNHGRLGLLTVFFLRVISCYSALSANRRSHLPPILQSNIPHPRPKTRSFDILVCMSIHTPHFFFFFLREHYISC